MTFSVKLALLVALLPFVVVSWWDVGHMLTAAIAEIQLNKLNPHAAANFRELTLSINKLCDNRTRTFIESSVWADDLKGRSYNMDIWNQWHFIDTPYVADATIPNINYTEAAFTSVWASVQAGMVLKKNIKNITAERALFARYLIHLVGDIHQPLHSVSLFNGSYHKGDMGGNLLKIKTLNGNLSNFHAFWDSGAYRLQNDSYSFKRPMDTQNSTALKLLALNLIDQYGDSVKELAKEISPKAWAKQSFLVAQNTTYPHVMVSNQADEAYTKLVHETSKKRITLAGFRLANFVIDIYENPTPDRTPSDSQKNIVIQKEEQSAQELMQRYTKEMFDLAEQNKGNLLTQFGQQVNEDILANLQTE